MTHRRLSKIDSFRTLKRKGLKFGTILDIGVQHDTPELREEFPDIHHVLFEPVREYHSEIKRNYSGVNYTLIDCAVSDNEDEMHLQDIHRHAGDTQVSHVTPVAGSGEGVRSVRTVTLDNFVRGRNLAKPYLLKIDVDGHETAILNGARSTLYDCACLIVETTMPHLPDRCNIAKAAGMCLWDIVDITYYEGNLYQVDLVFLPYSIIMFNKDLDPYSAISRQLDSSRWYEHPG